MSSNDHKYLIIRNKNGTYAILMCLGTYESKKEAEIFLDTFAASIDYERELEDYEEGTLH
tara:strand:- start:527 stop:706 length:180 start_codon:yes stop_codon:yes gene_type:complete